MAQYLGQEAKGRTGTLCPCSGCGSSSDSLRQRVKASPSHDMQFSNTMKHTCTLYVRLMGERERKKERVREREGQRGGERKRSKRESETREKEKK